MPETYMCGRCKKTVLGDDRHKHAVECWPPVTQEGGTVDKSLWELIAERSNRDPMARMIVQLVDRGQDRESILAQALLATMRTNDYIRRDLIEAVERRCPDLNRHG